MFKGHPKGLYVFLFANMGERFGYYTMIAIFILFLQARFGMDAEQAGRVYGTFLFGIYFIPLFGGILADKVLGFRKTILTGILLMIIGYFLLAQPGESKMFIYVALAIISVGTGFFKGNLQALVGRLYDEAKLNKFRDAAFNIFYMGINIGAFFAPSAAEGMNKWIMKKEGLLYNANIPGLAHEYLNSLSDGTVFAKAGEYATLAKTTLINGVYHFSNLETFSHDYINTLSKSYNYGFAIAAVSITLSLIIFLAFRKTYQHVIGRHKAIETTSSENTFSLTKKQRNKRLRALGLIFIVNIFFWMAFHQNGFTLTIFARDYTMQHVGAFTYTFFDLSALLPIISIIIGLVLVLGRNNTKLAKLIGTSLIIIGIPIAYIVISRFGNSMPITPPKFQQFNPIFIVFLTPVIIAIFTALNKKGREPSSPRKMGFGFLIAALAFFLMILASRGLIAPKNFEGGLLADSLRVTPYWLIAAYFSITIAELFYSPIGISFVSKVSPPEFVGFMQGGRLGSTAIGNMLAGLIGPFWQKWEMWQFFLLLVGILILSSIFIFSIMKTLESATKKE